MKIVVKYGDYMLVISEVIRIANKHFVDAMSLNEGKISIKSIYLKKSLTILIRMYPNAGI